MENSDQRWGNDTHSIVWERQGSDDAPYFTCHSDGLPLAEWYARRGGTEVWRGDLSRTTTAEQRARGFTPRDEWRD